MQRVPQKFIPGINSSALFKEVFDHLNLTLFNRVMQTRLVVCRINLFKYLLIWFILFSEEFQDSSCISTFAEVKKITHVTKPSWSPRRPCFPFQIEITFVESLNHFKLVISNPILFSDFLEIGSKVRANHSTCKFFSRERSETFAHELHYYVFVCIILCYYITPVFYLGWLVISSVFFLRNRFFLQNLFGAQRRFTSFRVTLELSFARSRSGCPQRHLILDILSFSSCCWPKPPLRTFLSRFFLRRWLFKVIIIVNRI
jgi:hypothetical protein